MSTLIFRPRGTSVALPHGGLPELFPPYLAELIAKTGGADGPIGKQFVAQPDEEQQHLHTGLTDPLQEETHEVAPGLVYKYRGQSDREGRALWTITNRCAAYCRFCTRGRKVGAATLPALGKAELNQTLAFIRNTPHLTEIILSGGDPLTIAPDILAYVLKELGTMQAEGKLRIVRIGTRLPIHNPRLMRLTHYAAIKQLRHPRVMVHVNHPLELTPETRTVIEKLQREAGAVVMSQSVLLAGVNDSVETLQQLFTELAGEGVVPYYLFQNDPVYWAQHFTVPLDKAIAMWQQLRLRLSGVAATARFVIDVTNGYGKVAVPEGGAWKVDYSVGYRDFQKATHTF